MKYLGIDYGSKRVGIAISDPDGTIAFPRTEFPNTEQLPRQVEDLIREEKIDIVVIGDTRALSGEKNPITEAADAFADELMNKKIHVERIWEAWSSIEASRYAPKEESHSDAAAAAIILQRFLDMRRAE